MKQRPLNKPGRKAGQAIIFLMMVLVIGTLAVLWNFDLHNIISTKLRIDNAGDAAALSAARWQGITLNMIGELNLSQAAYLCDQLSSIDLADSNQVQQIRDEAFQISTLRQRLALNGPLMGLVAAQAAALQNITEKDEQKIEDAVSRYLAERGSDFEYSGGYYKGVVEEPYPDAWAEYGGLVSAIANNTMLVECANAQYFLFYGSYHTLLDPSFYRAVAAGYWCYFKGGNNRYLIDNYIDFTSWEPLPPLQQRHTANSEYFGCDVWEWDAPLDFYYASTTTNQHSSGGYGYADRLTNYFPGLEIDSEGLMEDFTEYSGDVSPLDAADLGMLPDMVSIPFSWHYFEAWSWLNKRWENSQMYFPDSDDFPLHEGWRFRDEYNYGGADAAIDIRIDTQINTPNMRIVADSIYWQASAKAFGYLPDPSDPEDASRRRTPVYFGLVLPAFHDTRLIHNRLSTRPAGVKEPGYDEHIYKHLPAPEYMEQGVEAIRTNKCWYCKQLIKWEEQEFRLEGVEWLEENQEAIDAGEKCRPYEGDPHMGRG